jgi:hypothetical protein
MQTEVKGFSQKSREYLYDKYQIRVIHPEEQIRIQKTFCPRDPLGPDLVLKCYTTWASVLLAGC